MPLLLIFIDGVGIGTRGAHNPLDGAGGQILNFFQDEDFDLPFGGLAAITDAQLGVEGKPQSATGQTTILTGINAPLILGKHLSGFASGSLRGIINEHSLMKTLVERGQRVTFANAYNPSFFVKRPRFVSVSTLATEAAGVPFRTFADLAVGRAVHHEFTHCLLKGLGTPIAYRTPEEAGRILAGLAVEYDFCFYEHFITDFAGHSRDFAFAQDAIKQLDRFLISVLSPLDLTRTTVLLTSDHGNIEDVSIKGHTENSVATIAWGRQARELIGRVESLCDITPAILAALSETPTDCN